MDTDNKNYLSVFSLGSSTYLGNLQYGVIAVPIRDAIGSYLSSENPIDFSDVVPIYINEIIGLPWRNQEEFVFDRWGATANAMASYIDPNDPKMLAMRTRGGAAIKVIQKMATFCMRDLQMYTYCYDTGRYYETLIFPSARLYRIMEREWEQLPEPHVVALDNLINQYDEELAQEPEGPEEPDE